MYIPTTTPTCSVFTPELARIIMYKIIVHVVHNTYVNSYISDIIKAKDDSQ